MSKNRHIPFGYYMKQGCTHINENEACIVKQIFDNYEQGGSLKSITARLNASEILYNHEKSVWNKSNIKRILENEVYTGNAEIPCIISTEQFARVKGIYQEKSQKCKNVRKSSADILWKRLICSECSGRMLRNGGRLVAKGIKQLRCENKACHNSLDIQVTLLHQMILSSLQPPQSAHAKPYAPSTKVLKIENEILRELEKPKDAKRIRELILQGAAARFECLPRQELQRDTSAIDWKVFKQEGVYIKIASDHKVYVTSNIIRSEEENGNSKKCESNSGKPFADPIRKGEKQQGAVGGLLQSQHG